LFAVRTAPTSFSAPLLAVAYHVLSLAVAAQTALFAALKAHAHSSERVTFADRLFGNHRNLLSTN
jgi:hypothetical protein